MCLPLVPSTGYPLPSGRCHRSRKHSDAADPGGPGRRDDLELATAAIRAVLQIVLEHALEQPGPA